MPFAQPLPSPRNTNGANVLTSSPLRKPPLTNPDTDALSSETLPLRYNPDKISTPLLAQPRTGTLSSVWADEHFRLSAKSALDAPVSSRPGQSPTPTIARVALRPFSQAPVRSGAIGHARAISHDVTTGSSGDESGPPPTKMRPQSLVISRSDNIQPCTAQATKNAMGQRIHFASQPDLIDRPHLQDLQRSTTGLLRTMSKFAEKYVLEDLSITKPEQEVAGLHGRRKLQREQSIGSVKPSAASCFPSGWQHSKWMDQQRQFLQAYEYLCHIGEAKEWIEDIIHKQIPPIVELEEALRDGITLAEVIQAIHPERTLRIFRNPKLQFRHSDNIALFFRFLAEVDLPELFRFELVDLYEKKNIPKVIYCIHALSWLLFRNGIVDFRIGNLIGQLQFEHHELERTQQGLDKAGVCMPNFSGMSASFDIQPEPLPKERDEDRIERELVVSFKNTLDLQAQMRGVLVRLRLANTMQSLWDREPKLIGLQSRVRGDFARQVAKYRCDMRRIAVMLQSVARGHIARRHWAQSRQSRSAHAEQIVALQSLARARKCRIRIKANKTAFSRDHNQSVRSLQARIRGALARWVVGDQYYELRESESNLPALQALVRGFLVRKHRQEQERELQNITRSSAKWSSLQSKIRGRTARQLHAGRTHAAAEHAGSIGFLQAIIRGEQSRHDFTQLQQHLHAQSDSTTALQDRARGLFFRKKYIDNQNALQSCNAHVLGLQSLTRAYLQRNRTLDVLYALREEEPRINRLQSAATALLCRRGIGTLLTELEDREPDVAALQAAIRGTLVRSDFVERQRHYKKNMEKVIKVQSFFRARQQGEAYKTLTTGANPPVNTVKSFVHLLNDSDFDFDEEFEFERLRKTVTQHVRQNEMAEQYIDQLDIKIALLVKNKITLDEVVRHQKQFGGHVGSLLNKDIVVKDQFDLRALNKTSRRKLEYYQELFYVLQTQPQYLARLFRQFREQGLAGKETKKMEILMLGVFGFAQKRREEYYLLKLIAQSIREEAEACTTLADFSRSTFFWNKLLSAFLRSPRDRQYMKQLFGPLVRDDLFQQGLNLESDPRQIFRAAINNEELRTGQRSHRNPDVAREEAIRDPETRQSFVTHLQDLRDIADHFFALIGDTLHQMPFGVRYVAQQQFEILRLAFPQDDDHFLLQAVGQWIWQSYLSPALTQPEMYGVIDRGLGSAQKKNLVEVARAIGQVFGGKLFGGENVYLQPLNQWVSESMDRLDSLLSELINIRSAERHFDIDEFNDIYARAKPTLYIKMSDILAVHHLVAADPNSICGARDDLMRDILRELGSARNNETEMSGMQSQEIVLQLTGKFHDVQDADAEMKTFFMETKRLVLYIIRVESGANLLEILVKPITGEDEDRWHALLEEEAQNQLQASGRRHAAYESSLGETAPATLIDVGSMTYAGVKSAALENILLLERRGQVQRHDQYQAILNSIATDIRTKHRRRVERARELEDVRATLGQLNSKAGYLEEQLQSYNDYVEHAMLTLQNKKGKKRFLIPFTKQYNHEKELARSGRTPKFGSFKYSARSLAEKGVLVDWSGLSEDKWSRINITISSDEVGVFHIEGSSGSLMIPGASASVPLDDMLQAQFENLQYINLFSDKSLRLNVNLLLNLVYRKFFD